MTIDNMQRRRARAADLEGALEVRRLGATGLELRQTSDGMLQFSGYASVTERAYEVGDFEETMARGAWKRTLSERCDCVLLLNHDGLPLARTKSGTLTLTEDARGLRVDAQLNPADPDVARVAPKLARGDVDEMSVGFRVTSQQWSDDYSKRRITGASLHKGDCSIVTFGANDASTGGLVGVLRSLESELVECRAGLSADSRAEIRARISSVRRLLDGGVVLRRPDVSQRQRERLAVLERRATAARRVGAPVRADRSTDEYRERLRTLRNT